jgi:aldehyde dehydrogenase (NAD+)
MASLESDLRSEHILVFFTGSPRVGRIVAAAAAKHLTPVTLELGGKCPVVVDCNPETSNFQLAAKRLLWGKTVNVGQVRSPLHGLLGLRDAI